MPEWIKPQEGVTGLSSVIFHVGFLCFSDTGDSMSQPIKQKEFVFTKTELHDILVLSLKCYLEYLHFYNESDAVAISNAADSLIYELEIGEIGEIIEEDLK